MIRVRLASTAILLLVVTSQARADGKHATLPAAGRDTPDAWRATAWTEPYKVRFADPIASDAGYPEGRQWIDVDNDGVLDYCRVVGTANVYDSWISCNLETPAGGLKGFLRGRVNDWGYPEGRQWIKIGDQAAYCRVAGTGYPNSFILCTLISAAGLGETLQTTKLDWGYPDTRYWITVNGKAEFCRDIGERADHDTECRTIGGSINVRTSSIGDDKDHKP